MFADNQRISSLQMERQFLLTYLGPIFLVSNRLYQGRAGLWGIFFGALLLCVWNFFLHRHTGVYRNPDKYWGKYVSKCVWAIYECYLLVTGGWLLVQMCEMVKEYFLTGIPSWFVMGILTIVALSGCQNIQSRGRLAQASWSGVSILMGILLLLAAFDGREQFILDDWQQEWKVTEWKEILESTMSFVVSFLGIVLLPFLNVKTDGQGESTKASFWMIGKITAWTAGISLLLSVSFGKSGAESLKYPILHLMAGVKLPGGFLRRMDLIFLTVLFFMLLFSLGSIFFYSGYLGERFAVDWGRVPVAVGSLLLALFSDRIEGFGTEYGKIALWIFLPVFFILTVCHGILRKRVFLLLLLCIQFTGCQVVEPEKRAYPLAIGLDWNEQMQQYQMYLAMVSLEESTGQEKTGGEETVGQQGYLLLQGSNQEEIMKQYDNTQELYLDVGHVQAVVLGENLLNEKEKIEEILLELEGEQSLGNGVYVFQTEMMNEVFEKNGKQEDSLGKFLSGIYENRKESASAVTLGQVYRHLHNENECKELPTVSLVNSQLYVEKVSE